MLEAVVLAGGASTRMGSPKALLPAPDGRPFVVRIVDTLLAAGMARITIVTGPHHDAIARACAPLADAGHVRCVRNPDPARGQLSSLLTGLDAVAAADTEALLVTLVDVPMIRTGTVASVIDAWHRTRAPIVRPRVAGVHGHPVVFDRSTFAQLRSSPLEEGARTVVRALADRALSVDVDDSGCLRDIDTPADYQRLTDAG